MRSSANFPADNILITEWQQGDEKAFNQIYRRYHPRLFLLTFKTIKSEAVAEEIVHDVFMRVWRSKSKIDTEQSFQAYIFAIAKNEIFRFLRKSSAPQEVPQTYLPASPQGSNQTEQDV
ncbi:MAG TPA: hypothetical protein DEV81_13440, partial [Cyanobacteria bacterium UBA11049]|nr:hypothetical protein [Cyanobacteria bacterium UBA11049]